MKFGNPGWSYAGVPGFSSDTVNYCSIVFSREGQPAVAYEDYGHDGAATVRLFDGTSWVVVGTEGFSTPGAEDLQMGVDPAGTVYVVWDDAGARVMHYSWNLGTGDIPGSELMVFPNPFNLTLKVKRGNLPAGICHVLLYDAGGRPRISMTTQEQEFSMDCPDLAPGVYILELKAGNSVARKQVMKF